MTILPDEVTNRWNSIRGRPECDLALTPASVRKYLETPEADLVVERILESLVQLASYRVRERGFRSRQPAGPGDLATSEGLEAFLVPAVEGALEFSSVLKAITDEKQRQEFIAAILNDVGEVLSRWEKAQFSGKPYAEEEDIVEALNEKLQTKLDALNITEAAAMACRVSIHLLTLKHQPQGKEELFKKAIGEGLDDKRLLKALEEAIKFLVRAFQKAKTGQSEEDKIVNAEYAGDPGSGWSWTEWQDMPPMLFFTAAAVDAFAELDLYLIRPAEASVKAGDRSVLKAFYDENKAVIISFQLCVDMARRWIQNTVLPGLSLGAGQYEEPEITYLADESKLALYELELKRSGIVELQRSGKKYPPILYNNLYGLQILLWSWADWSDWSPKNKEGVEIDTKTKRWINQALAQLVYNYDSVPAMKEILRKVDHEFLLPGDKLYKPGFGDKCKYLDAGFLPSLTRLLVLFLVYGVGDRNLLEPVIRDLYVELLQNRTRTSKDYGMLWSADGVEIFSTQRATQALTFYWAYASGKEPSGRIGKKDGLEDMVILRNKTGYKIALEVLDEESKPQDRFVEVSSPVESQLPLPEWANVESFGEYFLNKFGEGQAAATVSDEEFPFKLEVSDLGDKVIRAVKEREIKQPDAAKIILNGLAEIWKKPTMMKSVRKLEFELLKQQHRELVPDQETQDDS